MTRRCLAAKAKAVITGECVGHSGFAFEWTSPAQLSSHFTGAVWIVIPHIEICEEVLMWDHFQNFMYKQDGRSGHGFSMRVDFFCCLFISASFTMHVNIENQKKRFLLIMVR